MKALQARLTYANVIATLALVIALGGASAFAATQIGKNSVGPKQLKKNAVLTAKIKDQAVTAAKIKNGALTGAQIDASTLGTVPSARSAAVAESAKSAQSLTPAEPWHVVGAPGEPIFENGWESETSSSSFETVAFYKDQIGIVHLRGIVITGIAGASVFTLPPGYRPADGKTVRIPITCTGCARPNDIVEIDGTSTAPEFSGTVYVYGSLDNLEGVSFRAEG